MGNIHPAVWVHILKMANKYYVDGIYDILDYYEIKYERKIGQTDILKNLDEQMQITIIRDIIEIPIFWFNDRDKSLLRNSEIGSYNYTMRQLQPRSSYSLLQDNLDQEPPLYVADEEKYWGEELLKLLEDYNGIIYDRRTKSLTIKDKGPLHILSKIVNSKVLLEIRFRDYFMNKIIDDINGNFRAGFYTPVLFLIRKLVENCLIYILENMFPRDVSNNIEIYYNVQKNRYKDFSDLITGLKSNQSNFKNKRAVTSLLTLIENLKNKTNSFVHHLEYNGSKEDIESIRIVEIIELLKRIDENNILEIRNILKDHNHHT